MITIKEEFLTEEKTQLAVQLGGWEAIGMWLAMKSFCSRKLTRGFVPDEAIDLLPGAPKRPRRALKALVECRLRQPNGTLGAGLVEQTEHGWLLHDHDDHATDAAEIELRRVADKERKALQRDRNKVAVALTQQGVTLSDARTRSRNMSRDDVTEFLRDLSRDVTGPTPARARGCADGRVHAGADGRVPQPSPAQPSPGEEDPPTPLENQDGANRGSSVAHYERFENSMAGTVPAKRADVLALHELWKAKFKFHGAKFRTGHDFDAVTLAVAIDTHGVDDCKLVVEYAPQDGMVSGKHDEHGAKHESIKYIFGNTDAFNRILRAAKESESKKSGTSISDMMARQRAAR